MMMMIMMVMMMMMKMMMIIMINLFFYVYFMVIHWFNYFYPINSLSKLVVLEMRENVIKFLPE